MANKIISASELTSSIDSLIAEVTGLNSFLDTDHWDNKAKSMLEKVALNIDEIDSSIANVQSQLHQAQMDFDSKPLYRRLLGKSGEIKSLEKHITLLQRERSKFDDLAERLQSTIDLTPNSPEEQKSLIKELRLQKKELQAQKKEVAAEMRTVRVESRQKSVQVTNYGFKSLNTLATTERRRLRLNREIELAPHEDRKATIERQILNLDRVILWAESIK
ncbi:hypothetical protein [Leptothrix ochracea]|uniref:hypothetical protein n=1 Tax=Leptothrix ochracea TaxID=735331 RepID=UPI0034E20690